MSAPVRPETVRALWGYMQHRYRTTVHDKRNAVEMVAVAYALERMGILSADTFLREYATTIGRRIYLPFSIGEGANLWSQIALSAHEHMHVEQLDHEGPAFLFNYLTRPAKRALYEVQALKTNLELHFWHTGQVLPARELAEGLRAYGLGDADITVARQALGMAAAQVRAGGVSEGPAKVAIAWLEANAPELRFGA